ncbi:MAG: FliM/FliN family flagellar motor switch protein [Bryobacteraceae bacterium]
MHDIVRHQGKRFVREENSAFDHFVEMWSKQLARCIQVFNGTEPTVTWSRVNDLPPGESEDLFWWKQALQGATRFTMWIGAHESTWNGIGRASEDADSDDAKAAYLEIISQTQQATASLVSSALPEHLECRKGQVGSGPKAESVIYALIGITVSGEQLPALVFVVDQSILDVLGGAADFGEKAAWGTGGSGLMLDRLLNLEMPISVALGRTKMPIRDLLKVVSGSVIELDQGVDDTADLIVHGTVVAKGEIVSVKGNYGIRIKELISQADRIDLHGLG